MQTKDAREARGLRAVLRGNALFSAASGLCLFAAAEWIGSVTGIGAPGWIRVVGVGLLGFAALLAGMTRRGADAPSAGLVALVIAGDALWVLASAFALSLWGERLTEAGQVAVGAVALAVLCFGVAQSYFLWRRERRAGGAA